MNRIFGIWIALAALAIGLVGNAVTAAVRYGALEQRVITLEATAEEAKVRLRAMDAQSLDIAVLKESVRNVDQKLAEIRQILLERRPQ